MIKKNISHIFFVSFTFLLASIPKAVAGPYQYISKIPFPIHLSLLANIFFLTLAIALMIEVKKVSHSKLWNNVIYGDLFAIFTSISLAVILSKTYFNSDLYVLSFSIAIFFSFAVLFDLVWHYFLVKPIIKKKLKLLRIKYISILIFFVAIAQTFVILLSQHIPPFLHTELVYGYAVIAICINVYIVYIAYSVSKGFSVKGFVHKPYLFGWIGLIPLVLHTFLIIYCMRGVIYTNFYLIFFWLIAVTFAVIYYGAFAIDYPSIIQPKWKALMPFDLPKVTAALTLAFLAVSIYFTAKEYPNFIIYQNIPYIFVIAFLLPFILAIILLFTYLKTISARTKLRYWYYLKYSLYIHIIITFYVLSQICLAWNNTTSITKLLCAMFGLASFAFYIFFALDLRKIHKDLIIKPTLDGLDIARYIVSLCSVFFLIFFGISFTYVKAYEVFGFDFVAYPVILFLIAFSLIALWYYLRVTHKAFEEFMRPNIWGKLSYLAAFIAFLLVYLIYTTLSTYIQSFPFHDFFFIGYFIAMVIWIASIRTLKGEPKYKETGKEDIVNLLNSYARNFLRTDILEGLWETAVDRYVQEDEVTEISFYPSRRKFDLENTDEPTRLKIAVGILLEMHKLPDTVKIAIIKQSLEETKAEIAAILNEKVLMLPEDLRSQFDEDLYYPILFEKMVNNLIRHLETFVPLSEQEKIFNRLKRKTEKNSSIRFERDRIRIMEGTKFSRDEFFDLFKSYLDSIEDKFPFKSFLLYELIREEIKKELDPYNITIGNLLDIVPTGLEELDEVMAGGLSKGSSTLIIAEETRTKHKILLAFIKQGLKERTNVIYATSKRPYQQIRGELLTDFKDLKNFVLIDLYETIHSEARVSRLIETKHRIIVPLNKILFQRSIVKMIKRHPKEESKIVVIDAYDDFLSYYSSDEILELLQKQIEGLKRWNCTCVISINPHSYLIIKEGVEEVKKNFGNVMILSGDDKAASVFIEKLYHGTPSKHIIRLH